MKLGSRVIPALFMRGGTSKGVVFLDRDLPADQAERDAVFRSVMGSPDPNGRQLNGMGGGVSSLSKICILAPPSRADADVDFTFAQIPVGEGPVDYAGNCGNMVSAMGPAALQFGLCVADNDQARLRIFNTNTSRIIVAEFPLDQGQLAATGDFAIDGVAGTGAPIRVSFLEPGGTKTGHLLPTGNVVDTLTLSDGDRVQASLIDAANPCVFVAARDLGKTGAEQPFELSNDAGFMARMEEIRVAGSVAMGLARDLSEARRIASLPKVAIVAPPTDALLLDGSVLRAGDSNLTVRMLSMEQPHRALPITGAICLAIASRITGTIVADQTCASSGPMTLAHPSGSITVDATIDQSGPVPYAVSGSAYRTARVLFSGNVHW